MLIFFLIILTYKLDIVTFSNFFIYWNLFITKGPVENQFIPLSFPVAQFSIIFPFSGTCSWLGCVLDHTLYHSYLLMSLSASLDFLFHEDKYRSLLLYPLGSSQLMCLVYSLWRRCSIPTEVVFYLCYEDPGGRMELEEV